MSYERKRISPTPPTKTIAPHKLICESTEKIIFCGSDVPHQLAIVDQTPPLRRFFMRRAMGA
jgi:hypothetical protein